MQSHYRWKSAPAALALIGLCAALLADQVRLTEFIDDKPESDPA